MLQSIDPGRHSEDRTDEDQHQVASRPVDKPRDHCDFSPQIQTLSAALRLLSASIRKLRGHHHLVVFGEPLLDLDATVAAPPEFDFARFKTPFTLVEQHNLPLAAVDDRAAGHGDDRSFRSSGDFDIGIHDRAAAPRPDLGNSISDPRGPCLRHQVRIDQRDFADENPIGIGAKPDAGLLSDLDQGKIALRDIDQHPDDVVIRDPEQNIARERRACR